MCEDLAKCEINDFMKDLAAWALERVWRKEFVFVIYKVLSTVKSFWNTSYHRGTLYCRGYNGEKAELLLMYKQHKQLQSLQKCRPLAVEGEAGVRGQMCHIVPLGHEQRSLGITKR